MEDLQELLELLKAQGVDFVIIGAHALAYHGFPRATKDIDIWASNDLENAERLAIALEDFGAALGPTGASDFAQPSQKMVRLGVPPHMVDILNIAGGESFAEVWRGRVEGTLLNVDVFYPSRDSLIRMKRAAGRPQDLVDLQKLGAEKDGR